MHTIEIPDIIKQFPVGVAIFEIYEFDGEPAFCFLIKEESKYIGMWGEKPMIEIRTGAMTSGAVVVCPLIVNVNGNEDLFYETWVNYHSKLGRPVMEILEKATPFRVLLINERNEVQRVIAVGNNFAKDTVRSMKKLLEDSYTWSMDEFDNMKDQISQKYPTVKSLWNYLGSMETRIN